MDRDRIGSRAMGKSVESQPSWLGIVRSPAMAARCSVFVDSWLEQQEMPTMPRIYTTGCRQVSLLR
jgi:hypothetical protein